MLDGSALRVSFAKEAPAKTDHPAALKGKGNTGENPKGGIPAGSSRKDSDRIDTCITVQPGQAGPLPASTAQRSGLSTDTDHQRWSGELELLASRRFRCKVEPLRSLSLSGSTIDP
jgi:hypothetical protein